MKMKKKQRTTDSRSKGIKEQKQEKEKGNAFIKQDHNTQETG